MNESVVLDETIKYPQDATIFAAVCCILFIIIGFLGNFISILALCRRTMLRNATTAFVISLCTADFLFCTINLPLTASRYIHQAWLLGDTACSLFPFFFYGNVGASLMSMTLITVNRFIIFNYHHLYGKIYKKRFVVLMIIFCWVFSFGLLMPTLTRAWGEFGLDKATFSCTILMRNGRSPKKFLFVVGFLIPCIVIILSHSSIIWKVRKSRRNVEAHTQVNRSSTNPLFKQTIHQKDESRLNRMIVIIFCSFVVCFLPLMIVNVFDSKYSFPTIHVVASVLAWMSSCINPFIYVGLNRHYRRAYYRFLCSKPRTQRTSFGSCFNRSNSEADFKTVVSEVIVLSDRNTTSPEGPKEENVV
ncbi:protein trapped in endoderm-1-like isoform X2 [Tachypleus tridentatus]|uniref:protein trapped in endoderm-1-like isoform X2 n=1 Tax=Tachypleus tridentatus TaxID=6853 RepID=UPI003FD13416